MVGVTRRQARYAIISVKAPTANLATTYLAVVSRSPPFEFSALPGCTLAFHLHSLSCFVRFLDMITFKEKYQPEKYGVGKDKPGLNKGIGANSIQ